MTGTQTGISDWDSSSLVGFDGRRAMLRLLGFQGFCFVTPG